MARKLKGLRKDKPIGGNMPAVALATNALPAQASVQITRPTMAPLRRALDMGSVDQRAGHDQRVFAPTHCRIVVLAPTNFVKAVTLV